MNGRSWSRLPLMAAVLCVCSASALAAATVDIDSFDLPPGKSVTIEFEVTVDSPMPPGDTQVCNQGTMTATNPVVGVLTDDPDVGGTTDPTCTTIQLIADLSVTKTDSAATEVPGTPVTYTIVAGNAGPATVADGVVTDTFPAALSGCTWTASVTAGTASGFDAAGAGNINDTGITLPAGGQITYVVTCNIDPAATGSLANTVSISSAATTDLSPANNSATDTDTLVPSSDVAISKTDGAATEVPGTSVTYTIVASNSGPSTATGVTVADTFPGILSGCSTTSLAAGGATGNDAGPTAGNINDGGITLPPSATVTYTATCTIAATATGSLANTATISAATTDPNSGNNSATDTDTLDPQADLSITKTDGVASEVPGTPVTYTITVLNNGPSQATGVTVTDTFPGILSGCSTTSVAGGGATGNDAGPFAGNINDSGITLPVGILVTYTSTCNIDGAATGSLVNTASVSTSVTDPTAGNNSATDTDTLVPSADVSITKTDGAATEVPGTSVTYTIVISNSGPSTAAGVTVTDTFPAILSGCSTTSVAAGGATGNDAGPSAGNISDGSITLPLGGTVTYTATCNIDPAATGSLANTASVSSTSTDPNGANNSATDTDTLVPSADVQITKSDGVSSVSPGASTTYTIVASNNGPSTATGVTVADTFPAFLTGCSTTSVAAGGATGNDAGPTAGNINDGGITLPPSGSVTYSATCNVDPGASGTIANTATVSTSTTDPNSGNNSATDSNTVQPLDFGDAPTAAQSGFAGSYPVTQAQDGARHVTLGITLGAARDNEANGLPTAPADGDDNDATDDEDGVGFPNDLVACGTMNVVVTASGAGVLDAWIDWNRDGDWADPLEQVATSLAVAAGSNNVSVSPPCALSPGTSFARFRLSSTGGLLVTGQAANGEVEDHQVTLYGLDFGDAPTTFPVTLANNGARHQVKGALFLGALTGDTEADGQPNATATLDDTTTSDDEDGVVFTGLIVPGAASSVQITASAAGIVNAWVDWNNNGTWEDPAERMFATLDQAVAAGVNNLPFNVPVSAPTNTTVYARFRLSSAGALAPTGFASGGEVEDHAVVIAPVADLNVTKTDGSATEVPGTAVTYTIVVANSGPNGVIGANFGDTFVGILSGCSWTSVAAGGASGNSSSSGGAITDALTLPSGSSVTYTVSCNISAAATGTLVNTATIGVPSGVFDPNAANNSATDTDTLTVTADVAITKTDGATTEVPGTSVVYTIVASNTTGPSVATGVTVADTFPAILSGCSTTSVAAGGATGNDAGPVAGNLNDTGITLPVGGTVTYTATCNIDAAATGTLANTATVSSTATDPTPGNNSATDTDTLTPEVDVAVTKTDGVTIEVPGTTVTYTMVVSNTSGPSVATGVTFTDTFAGILSGCSTTSVAAGGATGNDVGPVAGNLNDTGITLPAGGSVTYTATCTIAATATGSLVNTASATVGGGITDTNAANDSATDTDTLQPQADLGITKTDGATSEVPGTGITYTIVATNSGPSVDPSVTVTDLFPAALTGCSTTSVAAGGATGNDAGPIAGDVIDTSISMPVGSSVTYTVNCTIASSATGTLVNTASVKSSVVDPNAANDLATDTDTLTPATDLQIVKTADLTTVQGGEALTYTLTVTNNGPSDATSVVITDNLPAEVTFTSTTGCTEDPNGIPTCTLGTLAAGATVAVDVLVQVDPAPLPPSGFTNTATVAGNETDSVPGNNSSSVTLTTDIVPPTVDAVETAAGAIAGCGPNLRTTINEVDLVLSEAMATVGGTPEDADHPGNYRLFGTGGDFDFDNTGCSLVAGDAAVTIDSALYSANTPSAPQATVTLGVNGGVDLADGLYRLIACQTLEDLAGNQLAEDFVVDFRVDDGNLLVNGHYDCADAGTALDPWVLDPPAATQITRDGLDSESTAGLSGSLRISSPGTTASFGFNQCADTGAGLHNLNGLVLISAGPTVILGFGVECEAFSATGCAGTSLGLTSVEAPIVTTSGLWNLWELPDGLLLPTGTSSVRCGVTMNNPLASAYDAWFDQIRLVGESSIFEDGFESGNTSAWSLTVP